MVDNATNPIEKVALYDFFIKGGYMDYFTLNDMVLSLTSEGYLDSNKLHSSSYVAITDKGKEMVSDLMDRLSKRVEFDGEIGVICSTDNSKKTENGSDWQAFDESSPFEFK